MTPSVSGLKGLHSHLRVAGFGSRVMATGCCIMIGCLRAIASSVAGLAEWSKCLHSHLRVAGLVPRSWHLVTV